MWIELNPDLVIPLPHDLHFGEPLDFFHSLRHGRPAGANPWRAAGLEWTVPSPPPKHNFVETPTVARPAYDYPPHGARDG